MKSWSSAITLRAGSSHEQLGLNFSLSIESVTIRPISHYLCKFNDGTNNENWVTQCGEHSS